MDYRTTFVQTWTTLWKHKTILWFGFMPFVIPGLFALFISAVLVLFPLISMEHLASSSNDYPYMWLAVILVVVLLTIGSTAIGYAGILKGTVYAFTTVEAASFRKIWVACWPFVGRLVGMLLSIGFVISLITIFPALVGILTAGVAFLCLFPFLFLIIPLSFLLLAAMSFGMSAIVTDDLGVLAAIQRTSQVFRRNFWPLVFMAFILYILQAMVGFIIFSPLMIGPWLFFFLSSGNYVSPGLLYQIFGIVSAIVILLILTIQGFITTYIQSAWMLVYLRLTRSAPTKPQNA